MCCFSWSFKCRHPSLTQHSGQLHTQLIQHLAQICRRLWFPKLWSYSGIEAKMAEETRISKENQFVYWSLYIQRLNFNLHAVSTMFVIKLILAKLKHEAKTCFGGNGRGEEVSLKRKNNVFRMLSAGCFLSNWEECRPVLRWLNYMHHTKTN